jgi:hypothetical protein
MQRRVITITEWAKELGSRPKVYRYLAEFQKNNGKYDPRDILSVLDFQRFLIRRGYMNVFASQQSDN